jgi:hypothetical protein
MKSQKILVIALVVVLLMGLASGLSQAQGPGGAPPPPNPGAKQNEDAAKTAAKPSAILELSGDLGSGFSYQGTLTEGGVPVNGVRQMEFKLFDAASVGTQVGGTLTQDVTVSKGQFSTVLTWGSGEIDGRALWLAVQARDSGGIWRDLGRRQILAAPYAMSLMPGATIEAQTGSDAIVVSGPWDGIHAVSSASDGNHGAVYARATSSTGTAIAGNFATVSVDGFGVLGANSTTGVAVAGSMQGYAPSDINLIGYWLPAGLFSGRNGVVGLTKDPGGIGVAASCLATTGEDCRGIDARSSSTTGWAGRFVSSGNGVSISAGGAGKTGLAVSGGSKSAVVRTEGGSRLLYTEESAEVWFTDYGFGKLANGTAKVTIDPIFAQTVNLKEPYHVFVQVYGDADVYVTTRTATGFEVRLRSGDAAVEFSYRLAAKRLGFEAQRLERAAWADSDPNLYPEKVGTADGTSQPGAGTP